MVGRYDHGVAICCVVGGVAVGCFGGDIGGVGGIGVMSGAAVGVYDVIVVVAYGCMVVVGVDGGGGVTVVVSWS